MFEGLIRDVDNTLADRLSSSDELVTNDEMKDIHYLRLKIIDMQHQYRNALVQQAVELALMLREEGVLVIEALKWDGSLGSREVKLMERLGFLIDAYQVETWYWEVSEMLRKFIMTSLLVVVYDGSAPHLVGALIVTFIFILLHLQLHPYLNKGLNDFQRLA